MLKVDIVVPYAPTEEVVNGHRGKPKPSPQVLLFQVRDVFELTQASQRDLKRKKGSYGTYQNGGKLHKMVLISVGMKEIAMRRDLSPRHASFVPVAESLAIRFQSQIPVKSVRKDHCFEITNLKDSRKVSSVLVSSSYARYSTLRRSCCT